MTFKSKRSSGSHSSHGNTTTSRSSFNSGRKQPDREYKKRTESTIKEKPDPLETSDDDFNSGFGNYLRSPEGVELMKFFVVANSIVVILTMAWPSMKELFYICEDFVSYLTN